MRNTDYVKNIVLNIVLNNQIFCQGFYPVTRVNAYYTQQQNFDKISQTLHYLHGFIMDTIDR